MVGGTLAQREMVITVVGWREAAIGSVRNEKPYEAIESGETERPGSGIYAGGCLLRAIGGGGLGRARPTLPRPFFDRPS